MLEPMVAFPTVSGVLGLWVLVGGFHTHWPWKGPVLRAVGAFDVVACLAVIALALTGHDGIAFITFAITSLAIAAFAALSRRHKTIS